MVKCLLKSLESSESFDNCIKEYNAKPNAGDFIVVERAVTKSLYRVESVYFSEPNPDCDLMLNLIFYKRLH